MPASGGLPVLGMSCRLPNADNVQEFWEGLLTGKDMIEGCSCRWPDGLFSLPGRNGFLKDITKFDSEFFCMNENEAASTDPQVRVLLEVCYEAIFDSGISAEHLRNSTTGVYIGASFSEAELISWNVEGLKKKPILANCVSQFYQFNGPSIVYDTACSSSLTALHAAVQDLKVGRCQFALVGASSLLISPMTSSQFNRLCMLSADGNCKTFDESANGYVRSEGVIVILLATQLTSPYPRVYAKLIDIAINCDGHKNHDILHPNTETQVQLLKSMYNADKLDVNELAYIEAHGTGTQVGDAVETASIHEALCSGRSHPLLIGSVKSNIGHCETASGLASIVKVLLCIQHKTIPPNRNFKAANPNLHGIIKGDLEVVVKPTPLPEGFLAVNSFGFGGANAHVCFSPVKPVQEKIQDLENECEETLVLLCSQVSYLHSHLVDWILTFKNDPNVLCLVNKAMCLSICDNWKYRGYLIATKNNQDVKVIGNKKAEQLPLWVVSHDPVLRTYEPADPRLMSLPPFKMVVDTCEIELKDVMPDFVKLLFSTTLPSMADQIVLSIAMDLGCMNILKACGLEPDKIIGVGMGEIVAAHADKCLSIKEAIHLAYILSREVCPEDGTSYKIMDVLINANNIWEDFWEVRILAESGIDFCTVAFQPDMENKVLEKFDRKGIPHSDVKHIGPVYTAHLQHMLKVNLKDNLKSLIPENLRSDKWIPTFTINYLDRSLCCAEYFIKMITSPTSLKKALASMNKCSILFNLGLNRNSIDMITEQLPLVENKFFMSTKTLTGTLAALGNLHVAGLYVHVENLYSQTFPLPANTASTGYLVEWNHSRSWPIARWNQFTIKVVDCQYEYSLPKFHYENTIHAFAFYFWHIWLCVAQAKKTEVYNFGLILSDLKLSKINFQYSEQEIQILPESGTFEIIIKEKESFMSGHYEVRQDLAEFLDCPNKKSEKVKETQLWPKKLPENRKDLNFTWSGDWVCYMYRLLSVIYSELENKSHFGIHRIAFKPPPEGVIPTPQLLNETVHVEADTGLHWTEWVSIQTNIPPLNEKVTGLPFLERIKKMDQPKLTVKQDHLKMRKGQVSSFVHYGKYTIPFLTCFFIFLFLSNYTFSFPASTDAESSKWTKFLTSLIIAAFSAHFILYLFDKMWNFTSPQMRDEKQSSIKAELQVEDDWQIEDYVSEDEMTESFQVASSDCHCGFIVDSHLEETLNRIRTYYFTGGLLAIESSGCNHAEVPVGSLNLFKKDGCVYSLTTSVQTILINDVQFPLVPLYISYFITHILSDVTEGNVLFIPKDDVVLDPVFYSLLIFSKCQKNTVLLCHHGKTASLIQLKVHQVFPNVHLIPISKLYCETLKVTHGRGSSLIVSMVPEVKPYIGLTAIHGKYVQLVPLIQEQFGSSVFLRNTTFYNLTPSEMLKNLSQESLLEAAQLFKSTKIGAQDLLDCPDESHLYISQGIIQLSSKIYASSLWHLIGLDGTTDCQLSDRISPVDQKHLQNLRRFLKTVGNDFSSNNSHALFAPIPENNPEKTLTNIEDDLTPIDKNVKNVVTNSISNLLPINDLAEDSDHVNLFKFYMKEYLDGRIQPLPVFALNVGKNAKNGSKKAIFIILPSLISAKLMLKLYKLADRISHPSFAVKMCSETTPQDSLENIARHLARQMYKLHQGTFYLLGLEDGVRLTLQLAIELQTSYFKVSEVFLFENSPKLYKAQWDDWSDINSWWYWNTCYEFNKELEIVENKSEPTLSLVDAQMLTEFVKSFGVVVHKDFVNWLTALQAHTDRINFAVNYLITSKNTRSDRNRWFNATVRVINMKNQEKGDFFSVVMEVYRHHLLDKAKIYLGMMRLVQNYAFPRSKFSGNIMSIKLFGVYHDSIKERLFNSPKRCELYGSLEKILEKTSLELAEFINQKIWDS